MAVSGAKLSHPAIRQFTEQRRLLMGVAYRVLGRVSEAEDVVQDAWLRWMGVDHDAIVDPRGFLVRTTTRLALDRLRRERSRREAYVGPWLPEPLLTGQSPGGPDGAEHVELADSVSMAMLVVLETLSPLERAVFVLREAFGFSHAEIGAILDRTEPAVRQIARRARHHVRERRTRFDADRTVRRRATERFLAACGSGRVEDLLSVLAPGVELVADGGGLARAPRRPLRGAADIARFLAGGFATAPQDMRLEPADLNGGPGLLISLGGTPIGGCVVECVDERIVRILVVANPEKLRGLRYDHGVT